MVLGIAVFAVMDLNTKWLSAGYGMGQVLLARNAAALHKGAVDAEKANQRSVVEIDTLEKINAELIATLKETVQIQKEGEANREAAQVKMRQIESDLKNALLENAQQM